MPAGRVPGAAGGPIMGAPAAAAPAAAAAARAAGITVAVTPERDMHWHWRQPGASNQ